MATLTYHQRKNMPKSEFAFPSEKKGGKGGMPINDRPHARAALQAAGGARGAHPLSPKKKAELKRKIHAKFPSLAKPGKKAK
jgi:hypothetical protein